MASEDSSDSVVLLWDEGDGEIALPRGKKTFQPNDAKCITISDESDESVDWSEEVKHMNELRRRRNDAQTTSPGEIVKSKGAVFHHTCSMCSEPSKYRCPKCSRLSCSLACVKAHKETHYCDGKRDPKAFIPVEEFKESNLRSDFNFLEDINLTIDNAERARFSHGLMHKLPHNLFKMQQAARNRKTNLFILPLMFSKRKINTTYYRYIDTKIFWRVEWNFPLCNYTCSDDRIDEEETLVKCLDRFMWGDAEELVYYRSLGHEGVSVLIQDLNSPANEAKYLVLKKNKCLRSNFEGKKIVEFPTLLVVPNMHLSAYVEE